LVSTPYNETHRGLASIPFFFFFFHNQKWHLEFFKLVIIWWKKRGTNFLRMWKHIGPTWLVQQNGWCPCTCHCLQKWLKTIHLSLLPKFILVFYAMWIYWFSWFFVAHVGNNPCINEVCTKMKCNCLWLCFNHQDLLMTTLFSLLKSYHKVCVLYVQIIPRSSCLYSYHNAFEMASMLVGLEHTQCWLFVFWFLGFHYFLGYIFTIQWWEDPNDERDFHYYCEWCKSILFKNLNFRINVLINLNIIHLLVAPYLLWYKFIFFIVDKCRCGMFIVGLIRVQQQ
jgi:hypothetical protein